jgi:hypothetical protein
MILVRKQNSQLYEISHNATSKKKFKLKIKDVNDKEVSIPFVIPEGTTIPAYEVELVLSKKQTWSALWFKYSAGQVCEMISRI